MDLVESLEILFSKIPKWLRYILFLPAGFCTLPLVYYTIQLSLLIYAAPTSTYYIFVNYLAVNLIDLMFSIIVMYAMIPKYKYTIMLIFVVIACLLTSIGFITGENIVTCIVNIAAYITGLVIAKKNSSEE